MKNVTNNSLELIGLSAQKLKGKLGKAFLATLILIAPIMACIFSFYAIPVAVLLFGVMQTGYIRYMRDLIDDKQPSYKMIFGEFTNPGLEILLGTLLVCMFVLGSVLLIFPAIILIGLYSMSFYFAENKKATTPIDAMKHCRVHMKGNYTNMYAYKVLYWLGYVFLLVFGLVGVIISTKLWADYRVLSIVVFAVDFIFTTLVWAVISTYYNATNELFFRELLVYTGEVKEEAPVVEPVEEKVEAQPVKKVPAKRTTTTKAPAKKPTTSATKSAPVETKAPAKRTTTTKTIAQKTPAKKTTTTKKTTSK